MEEHSRLDHWRAPLRLHGQRAQGDALASPHPEYVQAVGGGDDDILAVH
jgi:hypothetical protein